MIIKYYRERVKEGLILLTGKLKMMTGIVLKDVVKSLFVEFFIAI